MKHHSLTTAFVVVFIFTTIFFSCKSYQPAFNIDNFYSEYNENIEFVESDSYLVLMPKDDEPGTFAEAGIIFYPGALVDYHSYIPLFAFCAEQKIACYIVEMPLDFAFMDKRIGGKIQKLHPEIKSWYMAGHSLGGAMAASYISEHAQDFEGLILLANWTGGGGQIDPPDPSETKTFAASRWPS